MAGAVLHHPCRDLQPERPKAATDQVAGVRSQRKRQCRRRRSMGWHKARNVTLSTPKRHLRLARSCPQLIHKHRRLIAWRLRVEIEHSAPELWMLASDRAAKPPQHRLRPCHETWRLAHRLRATRYDPEPRRAAFT